MKGWKTSSLLILLFGSQLLFTAHVLAQTVQAPRPDVRDTRPTVQPTPTLPNKADRTLEIRRVQEAVPCEDLGAEMKRGFENLKRMCSDPGGFGGERLRLFFLSKQWVEKKCDERAIDPKLKQDVRYLLWSGINSVQVRCIEACFDKSADLIKASRCEPAGTQCRECCLFVPSSGKERAECELGCQSVSLRCLQAEIRESDRQSLEDAKDHIKEIVRLLKEQAQRLAEAVQSLTRL